MSDLEVEGGIIVLRAQSRIVSSRHTWVLCRLPLAQEAESPFGHLG